MTSWSGHEEPGESQASKRRRSAEVLHGAGYDFMDLAERVGDWLVERFRTYKMSMEVQLRCMPDGRGYCKLVTFMAGSPTPTGREPPHTAILECFQ